MPRPRGGRGVRESRSALKVQAEAMRAEGMGWAAIARAVGVTPNAVRQWFVAPEDGDSNEPPPLPLLADEEIAALYQGRRYGRIEPGDTGVLRAVRPPSIEPQRSSWAA